MKKILCVISAAVLMSTSVQAACSRRVKIYPQNDRAVVYSANYKDINEFLYSLYGGRPKTTEATTEPTTEATTEAKEKPTSQAPNVAEKPAEDVTKASSVSDKVLEIVNRERAANGLSALKLDTALSKVAQAKAEDMLKNNYFSHTSPTYGSPFEMLKTFGISYRSAGENIAKGQKTPESVMQAWMASSGHRKNILGNYTRLGVGYVNKNGVTYWVQMFIS